MECIIHRRTQIFVVWNPNSHVRSAWPVCLGTVINTITRFLIWYHRQSYPLSDEFSHHIILTNSVFTTHHHLCLLLLNTVLVFFYSFHLWQKNYLDDLYGDKYNVSCICAQILNIWCFFQHCVKWNLGDTQGI